MHVAVLGLLGSALLGERRRGSCLFSRVSGERDFFFFSSDLLLSLFLVERRGDYREAVSVGSSLASPVLPAQAWARGAA